MRIFRYVCIFALFTAFAFNAFSQIGNARDAKNWTKITETPLATYYMDLTSIKGIGTKRRTFVLVDRSESNTRKGRSGFFELVFECSAGTVWLSYVEDYSGQMLSGNVLGWARDDEKWYPVEGAFTPVMKVVCS